MRQSNLQHGCERSETHGDELARIGAVVGVHQVDTGQSQVAGAQVVDDLLHVVISCVQLHLTNQRSVLICVNQ